MIKKFGEYEGRDVTCAVLADGDVSISMLNYGAVTQDWRVPLNGKRVPVVLGFDAFDDYLEHSKSFGIIAGRVANRTAFGQFEIHGESYQVSINEPPNHLHGGHLGLGRRIWNMDADGSKAVRLTHHSPDGEEGYPGAVDFTVDVTLDGNTVTYDMTGRPALAARHYTPTDQMQIPTGEIASVENTHFDFVNGAVIGAFDQSDQGIDLNMVLETDRDHGDPAAMVTSPSPCPVSMVKHMVPLPDYVWRPKNFLMRSTILISRP